MKKIKLLALSLLAIVSFTSCSDDSSGGGPSKNLVEIAAERPDLTTFVLALQLTGIDATLDGPESFTVYAPINSAFDEFLGQNGYASVNAVPVDVLKQLIYNHITMGNVDSQQIISGYRKTLAKGSASSTNFLDMFINREGGFKINGVSDLIVPDINAKNGKLNTVTKVLALPTVYDHIVANSDLNQMELALNADPNGVLKLLLQNVADSPFTVIGSSDAAYTTLLDNMGYDDFSEFPADDLDEILRYHIIGGQNILTQTISNNQSFETLSGQSFTFTLTGGGKKITDVNGNTGTMMQSDIQCANGIIHRLDRVLLPTL